MDCRLLHNTSDIILNLEGRRTYGDHPRALASIEENILQRIKLRNVYSCPREKEDDSPGINTVRRQLSTTFISGLSFSPDGLLLIASAGENIHLFDPNRGSIVKSIWEPHENVDIANLFFYNERSFFYSTTSGCLGFWDVRKLDAPLNYFKAHSSFMTKVLYDREKNWLLTIDKDGRLHYWYLPAFEFSGLELQDDHYGFLTNCPMLDQMCIVKDAYSKKLVMSSSSSNCFHIIDNLDFEELVKNRELNRLPIGGENFRMFLSMYPKVANKMIKNHLWYLDHDEFIPLSNANIYNISYMESFENTSTLLMRLTTSSTPAPDSIVSKRYRDWTVCVRLRDAPSNSLGGRSSFNLFQSFGSNVMHESLLYSAEESRFRTLMQKRNCISPCHRMIASPQSDGVKLYTFSSEFHTVTDAIQLKNQRNRLPSIFSSSSEPKNFHELDLLKFDTSVKAYPLCCKFSPLMGLLAVGDSLGRVSFYQP